MQLRVGLALFLSLALISGAVWLRGDKATKPIPTLSVVEKNTYTPQTNPNIDIATANLNEASGDPKTSNEKLSTTDLVGRQLILDYVSLAASGKATVENIDALANKYVDTIPSLSQTIKITVSDIKTVPNNKINLQNYSDSFRKLVNAHESDVNRIFSSSENLTNLGPELYSAAQTLSSIYSRTASKMRGLLIPVALSSVHINLINSYLSSADSMKSLSLAEEDEAVAFAGIIKISSNIGEETTLLTEINRILGKNGI